MQPDIVFPGLRADLTKLIYAFDDHSENGDATGYTLEVGV